ncbi:hypothetical protein ABT214_16490 [Micromonospora purpureochromogenes]|uniref:hypothetical protein n=1 Tax=Micromonospora purpureochromogenes TaxID=47872 RepID=UPI003321A24D
MTTRRGAAATLAGLLATAALFAALLPANMRMAAAAPGAGRAITRLLLTNRVVGSAAHRMLSSVDSAVH